jgi:hypothetical protein
MFCLYSNTVLRVFNGSQIGRKRMGAWASSVFLIVGPDEFVNKSPKVRPNPDFVKINTLIFRGKNSGYFFNLF